MANKQEQKKEAVKRLKALKIFSEAIKVFEKEGRVMVSEGGFLYDANEDQKELISSFEEEFGGLVYIVIHNNTEIGELYSLLYVSKEEEEWKMDWEDMREGYQVAAVYNMSNYIPELDIGSIGIQPRFGGLIRTE